MKRVLSILLALTMILSLSVCAFAWGSPDSECVHESDVYDVPRLSLLALPAQSCPRCSYA